MKVAIHQPHYLPWLPYLQKIARSDVFVILDSVAFEKNGMQNRNQIKTSQGPRWLTVPVKQRLGQLICDTEIDNTQDWRRKHWSSIRQNYAKAPAFGSYAGELEAVYAVSWNSLADLNIHLLGLLLRWFGISKKMLRSSELGVTGKASQLVLDICKKVGATEYLSGEGARDYMEGGLFEQAGLKVSYHLPVLPSAYPQQHAAVPFADDLSCVDVLFNCGQDWQRYAGGVRPGI